MNKAATITIQLGQEALQMACHDLLRAIGEHEDLRAEIVLAWLEKEIRKAPARALELVHLASEVLDEHNETGLVGA